MNTENPTIHPEFKPFSPREIEAIVRQALQEDIREGDLTSNAIIPEIVSAHGKIFAKEAGTVAGLQVAGICFHLRDPSVTFHSLAQDGQKVEKEQILATLEGRARSILSAERVALNFLQRMSGIATLTRQLVEAVKGTSAIILDTRKTVPGLRSLDKWAVVLGGGHNHRYGLFDQVLIKDNHITVAGGISEAVQRIRQHYRPDIFIEVEVKNLPELQEAINLKVQRIMLDNMSLAEMEEAVRITAGRIPLEASGNITLNNVAAVARTGVDYISVGWITHSVRALDISLLFEGTK